MRLSRFLFVFIFLSFFIIWPSNTGQAEEDTDTEISVIILDIPPTCQLLIGNSNVSKTLGGDGTAETAFNAGCVEFTAGEPTLTVSANKQWKLKAVITTGFALNGSYQKLNSDLKLKVTGAHSQLTDYQSIDTEKDIAWHTAGVANEAYSCQYKILLNWLKDIPGTYSATVTYTLSTNAS